MVAPECACLGRYQTIARSVSPVSCQVSRVGAVPKVLHVRQDGVCVAGFDKFKRRSPVMAGDGLVPEPSNRQIGIAGQLFDGS